MLTPQENLKSINQFLKEARKAVVSSIFLEKLGGLTIFAGILDFLCIQAARAIEQVVIKEDLIKARSFRITDPGAPHEDKWFYDNHISTRNIIKQISVFNRNLSSYPDIQRYTADMCKHANNFLNYRITVIHYVGNPIISREKMEEAVTKAIESFHKFNESFCFFRDKIHPFTFSKKEKQHFFGNDLTKGVVIMASKNT